MDYADFVEFLKTAGTFFKGVPLFFGGLRREVSDQIDVLAFDSAFPAADDLPVVNHHVAENDVHLVPALRRYCSIASRFL